MCELFLALLSSLVVGLAVWLAWRHLLAARWWALQREHGPLMSVEVAAEALNVSPDYVVTLLERKTLSSVMFRGQHRVRLINVLLYKVNRDFARREGLREITLLSQKMGSYERGQDDG